MCLQNAGYAQELFRRRRVRDMRVGEVRKRGFQGALIGVLTVAIVAIAALFVGSSLTTTLPQQEASAQHSSLFKEAESERDYLSERSTHVALPPELSLNTATPLRTNLGRGRTHLGHHLKYGYTWQPSTQSGCFARPFHRGEMAARPAHARWTTTSLRSAE